MADVRLEHVTKRFSKSVAALDDLTLEVGDGEFMILVGPSGCGKTTALRLVAGLEKPTWGTIAIGGRIVNDVTPRDRDIAMVFQNYALYPHMTVYKNLAYGLRQRRTPRNEVGRRVLDAKLRGQVRAELKRLHQRLAITSIYVTHDQVEAMTLADRICVMNGGALQQVGTPQEVYEHPANVFVAGFIGSPAMNLVPATVVDGQVQVAGHPVARAR